MQYHGRAAGFFSELLVSARFSDRILLEVGVARTIIVTLSSPGFPRDSLSVFEALFCRGLECHRLGSCRCLLSAARPPSLFGFFQASLSASILTASLRGRRYSNDILELAAA